MKPRARTAVGEILQAHGGLVVRRRHPELAGTLAYLVGHGDLVALLPGVYTTPRLAQDVWVRMRAGLLWDPDGVLTGSAAAAATFWPGVRVREIGLAVPRDRRAVTPGYRVTRRTIPPELIQIRGDLRATTPALTAIDLSASDGGEGIDTALRSRATTLTLLHEALARSPHRRGNGERRRLLLDSRDEPWSTAERRSHRLLRAAGITGWRANLAVGEPGRSYFIDIAFERERVAIEIDGRLHETDRDVFESDRWRQNWLVNHGWHVLRFTWAMLTEHPEEVIRQIRAALAARGGLAFAS